jgi:CHAT domain-containing protein
MLVVGADATRAAFLEAVQRANIVHFAGHGIVRPDAPLQSSLVLAPDDGRSHGALYARELSQLRLPATRLAILSGCHTAAGQLSSTEGATSLARSFFGAGVPAVVASLWAVDDGLTSEFFASYHRGVSQGEDPVHALRRTQREWISRKPDRWESFPVWAAFQFYGATRVTDRSRATERVSLTTQQAQATGAVTDQ